MGLLFQPARDCLSSTWPAPCSPPVRAHHSLHLGHLWPCSSYCLHHRHVFSPPSKSPMLLVSSGLSAVARVLGPFVSQSTITWRLVTPRPLFVLPSGVACAPPLARNRPSAIQRAENDRKRISEASASS